MTICNYYDSKDIGRILSVSRAIAYRIIKKLNSELNKQGYITISGKIPKEYFNARFYC